MLAQIRRFFRSNLGFGDFVFRTEMDGKEVARAKDVREMERRLAVVPEESLIYHASHNHFSVWLTARSEFGVAESLRPRQVSDFPSAEGLRQFIIDLLRESHRRTYRGVIADFHRNQFDRDVITRIGQGSIGGKARGIAFLNMSLANSPTDAFGGLRVQIPKSVVITTEAFDTFLDDNDFRDFAYGSNDDAEISKRFLEGRLADKLRSDLTFIAHQIPGPLAIRSSSLLEDSLHQPMAGIYSTLMIPNQARDPEQRLQEVCNAVKMVYASAFYSNAKSYLASTGNRVEEEKMAVIVQSLVGHRRAERYYPHYAGVAQSHNFYPIGPQKPEDGIAHVALGLGRLVVDGGLSLSFSPKHPQVLGQAGTLKMLLDSTQRGFYALDMESECCLPHSDLFSNVRFYGLEQAEEDGTLLAVGSVYSPEDQTIRDDLRLPGPRVVTFNNILRHGAIPLAETLERLLEIAEQGLGCPVEIEFACDMGDWGRSTRLNRERRDPILYMLQVRPFLSRTAHKEVKHLDYQQEQALCYSHRSLGHGVEESIQDIVYVRRDTWEAAANKQIAFEIGDLNKELAQDSRFYLLIGPGRWGTADPWLGIPVQWSQISNARAMVEASPKGYDVEPSQGTHFFQNISSLRVGYLTLPPGAEKSPPHDGDFMDWDWLDRQPAVTETEHLRHLRLTSPLTVALDGRDSEGVILKPADLQ